MWEAGRGWVVLKWKGDVINRKYVGVYLYENKSSVFSSRVKTNNVLLLRQWEISRSKKRLTGVPRLHEWPFLIGIWQSLACQRRNYLHISNILPLYSQLHPQV